MVVGVAVGVAEGGSVVGDAVVGLAVVGFAVVGFAVVGLAVVGAAEQAANAYRVVVSVHQTAKVFSVSEDETGRAVYTSMQTVFMHATAA
eukprot:21506-Heterococcus_DN1.PRE.2